MIGAALGMLPTDAGYPALVRRFLGIYQDSLCVGTRLFDGISEHLDELDARGIPWGIVTNKSQRFALPLLEQLDLRQRSACIVCGDSARRPKPHAHPLQLAGAVLGVATSNCIYVGDDERDVISGRSVGMRTVIAAWGYLGSEKPPREWGADAIVSAPDQILASR